MESNIRKDLNTEKETDLIDLILKLWTNRKWILKISIIGFVIGIVIAFSIPKEYATIVILAPENGSGSANGSANALAAMAGINLGGGVSDVDISPELYPNIVESTPFIVGLFDVPVRDLKNGIDTTFFSYMLDEQRTPWWSMVLQAPVKVIGLLTSKKEAESNEEKNGLFSFTKDQLKIFNNVKERVNITVDKKTGIITLNSTMQNAKISALIADTLTSYLQSYIITYRTQKARQDLIFAERLYAEAKKDYSDTQQKYARYLDENQNVILASYRVNQEKLQSEMALAYNVYTQVAQQFQLAKVKVQDTTPVYTVIQPAIVPLNPESPNKILIIIGFLFLATMSAAGWIIVKDFVVGMGSC